VTGWLVPSLQKMQTGAVHDYALLLQILIVLGLLLLAYPSVERANMFSVSSQTLALIFLLISVSLSIFFFLN
jgi:hypothetical protein